MRSMIGRGACGPYSSGNVRTMREGMSDSRIATQDDMRSR